MFKRFLVFAVCGAFLAGCEAEEHDAVDHEHSLDTSYPEGTLKDLPFSDAVRVGQMLYLSGSVGNLPGTLELAEGGITGETAQAMENIKATLEKYGSSLEEVVKCTIMMADIDEWSTMNGVYVSYFPNHKPARSAFGTSGLAINARVEIECLATVQ